MDQSNGLEAKISKEEIRITIMTDLQKLFLHPIEIFFARPNFAYDNNHPNNGTSYDQRPKQSFNRQDGNRSRKGSFNNSIGNWRNNGNFSRSPSTQRGDFSQNNSYRQPRTDQNNNSAFRGSDNRTDLQLVFHLTNTSSHKAIIRHHLMSFASPPLTIPLMNYQIFARWTTKVSELEHRKISKLKT